MKEGADKQDTRHLATLSEILDKPLLHSFLLTNDHETPRFGEETTAINASFFLG